MGLSALIDSLFTLYSWLILGRLLLSWIRLDSYHPLVQFLYRVTEPALGPARKMIPPAGGLDFSPIVVFMVLGATRIFVVYMLRRIGL